LGQKKGVTGQKETGAMAIFVKYCRRVNFSLKIIVRDGTGRGQGRRLAVIPEKGSSGAVRGGRFLPSGPRRVSSVASMKKANTSLMNNHLR
jgi:hypothetical protein